MRRLLLGALAVSLIAVGPQLRRADGDPPVQDDAARADRLAAEVRRLTEALAAADADCAEEIAQLQQELFRANSRRAERELAWYEYNRLLAELRIDDTVPPFGVDAEYLPDVEPEIDDSPAAELARHLARRTDEIQLSLQHFLMIEEIRGIDLLEVGSLDAGGVGPVVFRLLDDRGHLAGSLSAERLRLEASRAGHTVTLVLENGFESRGGERVAFAAGARRIVLPYVDPEPWIAELPELFPASQVALPVDDGRWNLVQLERTVNPLLREAAAATGGGYWRLSRIEGVLGDTLQLVQLEQFEPGGKLERRVFADRMTISREGAGVRLTLRDGVIVRAATRTPFVDGVYRIFLPRAEAERWAEAGVPGLVPEPDEQDEADEADERPAEDAEPADGDGPADGVQR